MSPRRILVTSALPYANGPLHIGHMVEQVQTDIWVRFQRLRGNQCTYLCADDTHGTPVMLRAQKEGRPELELIEEAHREHERDSKDFDVEHAHYGSTHSKTNERLCGELWQKLRAAGLVEERAISQLFDPERGMFLADRFVKGTCPRCGAPDQNGDSCEKCGATYAPTDLLNPRSTLSSATPILKSADHLFIQVERYHDFLANWTRKSGALQTSMSNYLDGQFLNKPLQDWDVSRPAPYFGFEISDSPGNYWYVWFDAPIGYMAATEEWAARTGANFDDYWKGGSTELVHFIGKDIVYFHTLFWPAVLEATGHRLPTRVHVHGWLTVNGAKMSKSSGTFIMARTYLDHLDPAYFRYYIATKLTPKVDDLDLDLADFEQRVNSDLVGKVVNLASRSSRFVAETGLSASYPDDEGLFAAGVRAGDEIAEAYEACDTNRAMRVIMSLADRANEFIDRKEPWKRKKEPGKEREVQDACSVALNLYRQIVIYLSPVLPRLAEKSAELLGRSLDSWDSAKTPLIGTPVGQYQHLMQRVTKEKIQAMVDASTAAGD